MRCTGERERKQETRELTVISQAANAGVEVIYMPRSGSRRGRETAL